MHELSITRNIVSIVAERAAGRRVKAVRLKVGRLAGVEVEALRFCFGVCCEGTSLAGAALEIEQPPGLGECQGCGETHELEQPLGTCPCGGRLRLVSGDELLVQSMEV